MTLEEAEAQWKADNPMPIYVHEDGERREITPEEYEAMAADRAVMLMEQDERQQALNQQSILEGQVVAAKPALKQYSAQLEESAGNAPPQVEALPGQGQDMVNMPELQQMVSELMTLVHGLIEALEGRGLLFPGEIAPKEQGDE
jgi:hypothetical protein